MSLFKKMDKPKSKSGTSTFEHVCFSYDGKHQILDDISFSVKKGEPLPL